MYDMVKVFFVILISFLKLLVWKACQCLLFVDVTYRSFDFKVTALNHGGGVGERERARD
jgi:hypothetical protein